MLPSPSESSVELAQAAFLVAIVAAIIAAIIAAIVVAIGQWSSWACSGRIAGLFRGLGADLKRNKSEI